MRDRGNAEKMSEGGRCFLVKESGLTKVTVSLGKVRNQLRSRGSRLGNEK